MVDITFGMDRAFGVKNVKTIAPLAANSVSGTASDAGKRYIIYNPWTQGEPVRESAKNSNSKTQTREMEAGSSEGRRSIKPLLEGTVNSSVERLSLPSVGKEGDYGNHFSPGAVNLLTPVGLAAPPLETQY